MIVAARPALMASADRCGSPSAVEGGFTLIELVVTVGIIGVLAAIALQSFAQYRDRAYDARAVHDLGNAVIAEEAYYAANFSYVSTGRITGPASIDVPGFVVSDTVELEVTARESGFTGTATSNRGTGTVYTFDSDGGSVVESQTP